MTVFMTILLILYAGMSAHANERDEALKDLVERLEYSGHRLVHAAISGDTLHVSAWPSGFGDPYQGMANIVTSAAKCNIPGVNTVSAVHAPWGVPVLRYTGRVDAPFPAGRWQGGGDSLLSDGKQSLQNLMLSVDVPFAASFGALDDPFIFRTGLRPELYWNPLNGIIGFAGVDLYAHNEYDPSAWYRPANMGVLYARSLSDRLSAATTWGAFGIDELWGAQVELDYGIGDSRLSLGMRSGLFGDFWFEDDRFGYDDPEHELALVRLSCADVPLDVTVHVQGGRYLYGDYGVEAGITRMFRELEVGFTGVVSEGEFNGYIHCAVPLFGKSGRRIAGGNIGMPPRVGYRYRYNSKTISHDPTSRPRGFEPFYIPGWRTVAGSASPAHMRSRSGSGL